MLTNDSIYSKTWNSRHIDPELLLILMDNDNQQKLVLQEKQTLLMMRKLSWLLLERWRMILRIACWSLSSFPAVFGLRHSAYGVDVHLHSQYQRRLVVLCLSLILIWARSNLRRIWRENKRHHLNFCATPFSNFPPLIAERKPPTLNHGTIRSPISNSSAAAVWSFKSVQHWCRNDHYCQ